jgi:hypothetical protein
MNKVLIDTAISILIYIIKILIGKASERLQNIQRDIEIDKEVAAKVERLRNAQTNEEVVSSLRDLNL